MWCSEGREGVNCCFNKQLRISIHHPVCRTAIEQSTYVHYDIPDTLVTLPCSIYCTMIGGEGMGFGRYDYNCYNHGRFPTYSLSDNLLELNKNSRNKLLFIHTYNRCYCSRLHTYVGTLLLAILAMDPAIAIRRLNLQPTKPTSKQASKASTTCLLGKNEAS